ncbi:pyruvate kinase [Candidatus Thiodictyon syntrophicum]|uniref:pyruvate kinase n=1 Tax=Candidatus Thiodictyon syntrophicum TaxID=1166950 RepID=A0A2K8UI82_9GAMM|nr:pyruvate kinase [Candidatus Thiodictyon syntrophicum]AUB85284.1 pyruvate kinase [Candidatus Thiodictyon syntrophicum]
MPPTPAQVAALAAQLVALRDGALALEQRFGDELAAIAPQQRASARNLLHYLSVRRHDIRALQQDLSALGLSSLGVLEPHALASLNAVIGVLAQLQDAAPGGGHPPLPPPPVDFRSGPQRLREHALALLGPEPQGRLVRIMVTMPSEAATDAQLVQDLLDAGMDVMRINCAHDGPAEWAAMVENLRRAEQSRGRSCRVAMDLAGPKLRTGALRASGRVQRLAPQRDCFGRLTRPGRVWLTPAEAAEPRPPGLRLRLEISGGLLGQLAMGDQLEFTDARGQEHRLLVREARGASWVAEIEQTAYVEEATRVTARRDGETVGSGAFINVPEVIEPIALAVGELLILTRCDAPGQGAERAADGTVVTPAQVHCTLATAFEFARPGHTVWFDDGKIGGVVAANDGERITVSITQTGPKGARLRAEKGINFPDTPLAMSALTDKDLADLPAIVRLADMVQLSFVREPQDLAQLHAELDRLGAQRMGVVLKIENRRAFENLPRLLLASLHRPPVGVMIARGDLAVEVGFERLSEVQQEILWLCEAAHVPVIWATQILEGMAKTGAPSRAEVSDAGMSIMAECAMLNKGPRIVETVRFLAGIIDRMDEHYRKQRATLRRLAVADLED